MPRIFRFTLGTIAVLLAVAAAYTMARNPERHTLDAAARDTVAGKFVKLRDGITHYELGGPPGARTVVLVHGFSVPAYIWDSTFKALTAAGFQVLRYDVLGRGWSDRPDVAYDGEVFDEQLNGLLDSLRITVPIDLMGLSYGGFITAHYVSTHRARINTLTLMDPIADGRTLPALLTKPVVGEWIWQITQVPGMADNQASDFLHPEHFPKWADLYRPQMRYRGFGRALLRSAVTSSKTDFNALYASAGATHVPTLLVWGEQDSTVPIARSTVVRSGIPDAEFFPVDSSGHLPHIEQSHKVHAKMLEFLQAHPVAVPHVN